MFSRRSTGFAPLFLCLAMMLVPLAALPQDLIKPGRDALAEAMKDFA